MLTIHKRGRKYYVRGRVRGVLVRQSLDTQFKGEAEHRAQEIERELYSGKRVRLVSWKTFQEEFVAAVRPSVSRSTLRKYQYVAERFGESLESQSVAGVQLIASSTIAAYLSGRRLGAEGAKSDQRILHRILAHAVQVGLLDRNPVVYKNLTSRSRNTQPFSPEEVSRMFAAACKVTSPFPNATPPRPDLPAILLAFVSTGLRISDVCGLEKRDVNLKSEIIIRRTQKRGKVVAIPMHKELVEAMEKHFDSQAPAQRSSSYVFPTDSGKMTLPETLDAMLRRLWKRAGIHGAHAHRFRDTFSVRLLEQGASLYDVAQLLGITIQVCERHYAPYVKELRQRGQRLISMISFADATHRSHSPNEQSSRDAPQR